MPDLHSLVDRVHYEGKREYTKRRGDVYYLDGTPLSRPFEMPRTQRLIAAVILVVAIIIGYFMINEFVVSRIQASVTSEQAVESNLAREASVESIPQVASLLNLDNDSIIATFEEAGYTIYNASGTDDSVELLLYKIPSDMTVADAAVLYSNGLNNLNAEQASKLLNGSWSFSADRVNGTSMVVRYADFSTGDMNVAVQNAIYKENFDAASITDTGVDESGNTYSQGTIQIDDAVCTWRVSALPLKEIYSIAGLPESACYVGVRITAA